MKPPPNLRKRKSLLPSLDLPPAAYPPSTILKSAPANVPQAETEFPFEEQEEPIHTIEQQEGPIKIVSPPISDSEDSTTDDDNKHTEESKHKPSKRAWKTHFYCLKNL